MPRPLYIICSASGALDSYTNAISLFGIIEYLRFREAEPQADGAVVAPPLSMRVVATWIKEKEDSLTDKFEAQLAVFIEGIEKEIMTTDFPLFSFEVPVHRLVLPELSFPSNLDIPDGLLRFQCRLRRAGEKEWRWHQEYAIQTEQLPVEKTAIQSIPPK